MPKGKVGKGQISGCGLVIPAKSVDYWENRFEEHKIEYTTTERDFLTISLCFRTPIER
ncbi:hypothetical protein [Halocatena marina]|uniref:Uncharacterized protein n=2 Tax=Halocatena marina TaxID=2934937 RepID=A0ABD5YLI1_9EURY|nr:hypothetical protein [Halocatena marina]